MKKYNILVFPCGSEIGLEIYRSLRYSSHISLYGASSADDHGRYVYENYIDNLPYIDSNEIISELKKVVDKYQIDAIYPTMDKVIWVLKTNEAKLGCRVIASAANTTEICLSKFNTYEKLKEKVTVPKVYKDINKIEEFPVFIKPVIGYGARDVFKADSLTEIKSFFIQRDRNDYLIMEYLPYKEYTVDCFTDRNGKLLYVGPRERKRITNGISHNTLPVQENIELFNHIASVINENIEFRGSWFFQVKENKTGKLTLLEIASRLGGASALYRGKGINFALLSVFDAFDVEIQISENNYNLVMDKALYNKFQIEIDYSTVYVDWDDCVIVGEKINTELIAFLFQAFCNKKKIVLISKHDGDLEPLLKEYRLEPLFDEVIHILRKDEKYKYIQDKKGIFIDDSFSERKKIQEKIGIPVFSPDMIEALLNK